MSHIVVTGHSVAYVYLSLRGVPDIGPVTHLISIADPRVPPTLPPHNTLPTRRILCLAFEDKDVGLPGVRLVGQALEFAQSAMLPQDVLLIHCAAGVSRSTAIALVILAERMGPGREHAAVEELWRIRPLAWPNDSVVTIGDAILGRAGQLLREMRLKKASLSGVLV